MAQLLEKRWLSYLLIVAFIVAKIPTLHYPYFWDESWVYAPSIFRMYEHGPSLLPNAIPVEYSRGHPLLYQAACAGWMKVFGTSHISTHSFALLIAVLLAIATYEIMRRLFNSRVAFVSVILLLLHTRFYTESAALLTDIPLALLALLGIYFYTSRKYLLASLSLTLLFFTKESGWVAGIAIALDILLSLVRRKPKGEELMRKLLTLAIPCLLTFLFFIVQKHMLGWYINPGHTSLVNLSLDNTLYNLNRTIYVMFYDEQVYYRFLLLIPLVIVAAVKQRKSKDLVILLPIAMIYACIFFFSHKDAVTYIFMGTIAMASITYVLRPPAASNNTSERFIKLITLFALLFIYFSCVNFWEGRYLYPAMYVVCILALAILYDHYLVRANGTKYFPLLVIGLFIAGVLSFRKDSEELNQYRRMDVQQEVTDFFENNNFYNKGIYTKAYLHEVHLEDRTSGFLHSKKHFTDVNDKLDSTRTLLIFDNIEPDAQYATSKTDTAFFLLKRFEKGTVWAEVYRRKGHGN
jgi:4-amino-4-deoxy-L-arabinose transferase-like glycosyltransferase